MLRFLAGTPRRVLRTGGVAAASVAAGVLLGALDRFGEGWQLYLLVFVAPTVLGVFGGVLINRQNFLSIYQAGQPSRFAFGDGRIIVDLNGTSFLIEIKHLKRVRRIWGLAVLDCDDEKMLVVPLDVIPGSN
jgi:hypothetical protein